MLFKRQLTLVGRSYFLIASLVAVNLAIWLVAIGLFSTSDKSRVLSLAAIAYTLGLRHALGRCIVAESIVDSNLLSLLQMPITSGLYNRKIRIHMHYN